MTDLSNIGREAKELDTKHISERIRLEKRSLKKIIVAIAFYGIGMFFKFIDQESKDSTLSSLGAESRSTFINVFSQLLVLLLIAISHLFVLFLRTCDPDTANGWCSK